MSQTGTFTPQNKKILLLQNPSGQKPIILFQTRLRVNTDGSPLSYHPQDLRGRGMALNNICNAVVVRKAGSSGNLCFTAFGEAIGVFERFRDTKYQTVPDGFQITWANVLATVKDQGKDVPCVFTSGAFKGYFGSLTALKNGLTGNKGECDLNDQVNPMAVPALVLVGGNSVVQTIRRQSGRSAGCVQSGDATFQFGHRRRHGTGGQSWRGVGASEHEAARNNRSADEQS